MRATSWIRNTLLASAALVCAVSARAANGPVIHFISAPVVAPQKTVAVSESSRARDEAPPAIVLDELQRQAPFPNAQITASRYRAVSGCKVESAELSAPLVASGTTSLRVSGRGANGKPCSAYAFVDVKVVTDALVATKPIREGAALEGSVRIVRREIIHGETPLTQLPAGVVASRSLSTGQLVESQVYRSPALAPGTAVRIVVYTGALSLEMNGQIARCVDVGASERTCAMLPSGKRIEGQYENGVLLVEQP